jgi:GTPase SAR1 family protein
MSSKKVSRHVMICGLEASGKTTLFNLLVYGQPQELKNKPDIILDTHKEGAKEKETLGFNFEYAEPNQTANCIGFWDLGGKDTIRAIWPSFYKNIQISGLIFVVNANDEDDRIIEARMELQKLLNEEELRSSVLYVVFNDIITKEDEEDKFNRVSDDPTIRQTVFF